MGRFAIVGPAYPLRGGIAQYSASLFLTLSRRHEVLLVSYRRQYPSLLFPGRTQLDTSGQPLAVPATPLLDPLWPPTWSRAVGELRRFRPDAVLVMWWNPFFALMLAHVTHGIRRSQGIPVAFLCHNVQPHESTLLDRWLLRRAFAAPTHFLVQSVAEKSALDRIRPGVPVEVVFHPAQSFFQRGQPLGRIRARETLVERGVLPGNAPGGTNLGSRRILLFFGHVRHYKGLDVLLKALASARARLEMELLVAGEFYEQRREYDRLARSLGVSQCVHVVDRFIPNEEVAEYFEAADLVVLPYRSGTQSGVLPLAFQFARPAIVTRVGGIPEVLEDGRTGMLVEPEDAEELGEALVRFFQEDLGPAMQPNLKAAAERLSWDALVARIEHFIGPGQNSDGGGQ